jgi:hypothetical protein
MKPNNTVLVPSQPNAQRRRTSGRRLSPLLAGSVLAVGLQTAALAQTGLINFYADPSGTTAVTGPAVVGNSGDVWNGLTSANGTISDAVNSLGAASGVSLTQSGAGGSSDVMQNNGQTSATALLESSYWNLSYWGNGPITTTITGLTPDTDYDLYVYMTGRGAGSGGTATWVDGTGTTIVGTTDCTANTQEASFNLGENYALLVGESDGTGKIVFAETADPSGDAAWAWNGLQIEAGSAVPEPGTIALGMMGAAALLLRRRK